jgi:import inner membrane translocase subunit TIM16
VIYGISFFQSAPKIIIQILITGTQIFGKALLEAGRQAAKSASPCDAARIRAHSFTTDAKHRPQGAMGSDVAGVGNATTGSLTDKLTREHRMTLDEAHLILNTKREEAMEQILQVCPSESRC